MRSSMIAKFAHQGALLSPIMSWFALAQAAAPGNPSLCCAALKASDVSERTAFPDSVAYDEFLNSYFAANAQLHPTCIVQPLTAQDVSITIQSLTSSTAELGPCLFAVRSGGHTASLGSSNIESRVTIDLSFLNQTVYDPTTGLASIQPGARWDAVYETLLRDNVMMPGGRSSSVGVGGFLTGGGDSFFAARVGLSCDNVVGYEVVLADGSIKTVSSKPHQSPDLFKALKGGSSNLGIVTLFTMTVFPAEDVWGGAVVYDTSVAPQYIAAATRFTESVIPTDPNAAWVGFFSYNSTTQREAIFSSLAYTRPVPWPAAFDGFFRIPNITHTLRRTTILAMTRENNFSPQFRHVVQTGTYLNRAEILSNVLAIQSERIRLAAVSHPQSTSYVLQAIVQPWVPRFWADSESRGGNILGLERYNKAMLNIAWDYSWDSSADDSFFYELSQSSREMLDIYAKSTGSFREYIYLNYADRTQNPLAGYGEDNVEFLRGVATKYDPHGVFQHLVPGGFKISRA
ncbi:hypothetical protein ASPCAL00499 [Aspergillus calidoustus]|uniref:FAD-binding PCMH-type domain-containing protein n=1 Tax=Aspergillus calidoustus TaxID=454130 RepID=A0A0U5FNK6_ASPCI|nr:hypothetical protein ASPCAL00499 [Aspergillus calidoustus]